MANFKRRKCRRNAFRALRGSETSRRALLGIKPHRVPPHGPWFDKRSERDRIWPRWYNLYSTNPAWFDREFHIRPHRAATKRAEKAVLQGADPDEVIWPLRRKPHQWYW